MKFITRSLRPLGMFLIFTFATWAIFGSIFVRNTGSSNFFVNILEYTISFENRFYDFRMGSQLNPEYKSPDIRFVKIDDYSLQKIGSWPIPRTVHAKMLNKLKAFGAKVVALDVMFPEKSPNIGNTSPDAAFAQAIKDFQTDGRRVFLAFTFAEEGEESLAEAPLEMLNDAVQTRNVPEVDMVARKINRFTFPIEEFVTTEVGLGSISNSDDSDGVFRKYQLIANIDTIYYGSLAFNSFEAFSGKKNTVRIFADATGELVINNKVLELSDMAETKIRYIGGEEVFPTANLYDVISKPDNDPEMIALFKDKMVFVGSTANGAHDLRASPINSKMPGVFAHLNMAHMLNHQYFYQLNNDSVKYSLCVLFIGMLIFIFVQYFGNAFLDAVVIFVILGICYLADRYYFLPNGYELKLFYCFFCFIACYTWNTFLQFYAAAKEKKQIKGAFSRYVAPTVVDEMLKDPDNIQVGGKKMDITCLFSDVRDFTSISEGMTATELAHSLNRYMGEMTDIVFDTKGTLDKYIGDAIVALWGAPLQIGNHAQFAVEGAIKMMEALPAINEEFKQLGRPEFRVGIGLNSGECSVGNMGSSRIFSYTALGDNMNLGARLESLCKHYGAQILISEYTLARLDVSQMKTRPIDRVIVKGKTTPVAIFEVLHKFHYLWADDEALKTFNQAHQLFMNKEFATAQAFFEGLSTKFPEDKPSKRFKDLCKKLHNQPELVTENFDVTKMTEK